MKTPEHDTLSPWERAVFRPGSVETALGGHKGRPYGSEGEAPGGEDGSGLAISSRINSRAGKRNARHQRF